jgi:hypothetical protein
MDLRRFLLTIGPGCHGHAELPSIAVFLEQHRWNPVDSSFYQAEQPFLTTGLHIAAYFGLPNIAQRFISEQYSVVQSRQQCAAR